MNNSGTYFQVQQSTVHRKTVIIQLNILQDIQRRSMTHTLVSSTMNEM